MTRIFLALIACTLVAACSDEALITSAFPDRERFAFRTSDGESIFQYACDAKATPDATRANAKQAHIFTDKEMTRIIDAGATQILANVPMEQVTKRIDTDTGALVDTVEDRFACLVYSFPDV